MGFHAKIISHSLGPPDSLAHFQSNFQILDAICGGERKTKFDLDFKSGVSEVKVGLW